MLMRFLVLMLAWMIPQALRANDSAATDALTVELAAMAKDFAKIIEKQGGGAVAIGEFSASTDVRASVGPRIQLVLAEQFRALSVPVSTTEFRFEIKGDYQPLVDKETNLLGVKLIGRLIDRETAEPLAERPTGRFVFGAETVPGMLGLTLPIPHNADPRELSNAFKEAQKHHPSSLQGTRISSSPTSPFAIEILVKSGDGYQARPAQADEADHGRLFVPLKHSEIYAIRLINDAPYTVAVNLQIDGVSSLAFDEDKARFWIIDPKSPATIRGWQVKAKEAIEFKVESEFANTAAAKLNLKPSSTVGLITASFSAAWEKDSDRPADEPTTRGTGFGKPIVSNTEKVKVTVGQVRDMISVRYER